MTDDVMTCDHAMPVVLMTRQSRMITASSITHLATRSIGADVHAVGRRHGAESSRGRSAGSKRKHKRGESHHARS